MGEQGVGQRILGVLEVRITAAVTAELGRHAPMSLAALAAVVRLGLAAGRLQAIAGAQTVAASGHASQHLHRRRVGRGDRLLNLVQLLGHGGGGRLDRTEAALDYFVRLFARVAARTGEQPRNIYKSHLLVAFAKYDNKFPIFDNFLTYLRLFMAFSMNNWGTLNSGLRRDRRVGV